jgi:peptide deformylase
MALLQILRCPHPNLRLKAEPLNDFGPETQKLIDALLDTMYETNGIGLAAVQVNVQKQLSVIDVSQAGNEPLVLINPLIVEKKGEQEEEEGCLSVPNVFAKVKRAEFVQVRALDRYGKPFEVNGTGLLAACLQHEIDHSNGILFIDYLSRLKQSLLLKKMEKLQRRSL